MKHTYKWPPSGLYDISVVESWLSDQGRAGYFPKKIRGERIAFVKGEPAEIRYRLEPVVDHWEKQPSDEMQAYYKEAGWDYVDAIKSVMGSECYLWQSNRADIGELHTDPVVQSEAYQEFYKRRRVGILFYVVLIAVIWILSVIAPFWLGMSIRYLLSSSYMFLLVLAETIMTVKMVRRVHDIGKLKKALAEGVGMNHTVTYHRKEQMRKVGWVLRWIGFVFILWCCYYSFTQIWSEEISDVADPLPFLSLEVIEQREHTLLLDGMADNINGSNTVVHSATPIVLPHEYSFFQDGQTADGVVSARTDYYELGFALIVQPLFNELLEGALVEGDIDKGEKTVTKLSHPYFDRVVLVETASRDRLLACQGKQLIEIRYTGEVDLRDRLDDLAEVFETAK